MNDLAISVNSNQVINNDNSIQSLNQINNALTLYRSRGGIIICAHNLGKVEKM